MTDLSKLFAYFCLLITGGAALRRCGRGDWGGRFAGWYFLGGFVATHVATVLILLMLIG